MKKIGKLRHWKQRFDENAAFIWRKSVLYKKIETKIGKKIPAELSANRTKLKRFWEAGLIELALFEAPENILQPTQAASANEEQPTQADGANEEQPAQADGANEEQPAQADGAKQNVKRKSKKAIGR